MLRQYIAGQSLCLCEGARLNAFLRRAEEESPEDFWNDYEEALYPARPEMEVQEESGLAIIPIAGIITKGLPVFFQRYFGLCDVTRVAEMVDAAAQNPAVTRVAFRIDSPGGYITGVPELAEKIASLTATPGKTTFAYTEDMIASAAYWLASQCGRIYCTPSSMVGSVGVYCTYLDSSAAAEANGLRVQVFKSGDLKGIGIPGTSLTQEQADFIQASIDRAGAQFRATVKAVRPGIQDDALRGQCLEGDLAVAAGLADALVSDFGGALRKRG